MGVGGAGAGEGGVYAASRFEIMVEAVVIDIDKRRADFAMLVCCI